MKKKKLFSVLLSSLFLLPSLAVLGGCGAEETVTLRVYNWEEYIDEGDEETDDVITLFEQWYRETYPDETPVRVDYSTFGTNEDMYNQLKLGNEYDLLCPSDYMIMKLAAENRLEPYDDSFFDKNNELNYYIRNVSPFIQDVFKENKANKDDPNDDKTWSNYAAGYMWGVTGYVYNDNGTPTIREDLERLGWSIMTDAKYANKVTTKDNIRDTYFVALAITYREEILALDASAPDYNEKLTKILNRTDEQSISEVEKTMEKIDNNVFSYETDSGKTDIISGKIHLNLAWSGDGVYAMTPDEDEDEHARDALSYFVPDECANLWFDGWVMPKGAHKKEAQAFVNFMSMPENAIRNMDYIGYSGAIAGEEVLEHLKEEYEADENDADTVLYDLSYFFRDTVEDATFYANRVNATRKKLFAHYPPSSVTARCAVMDYPGEAANDRMNELWTRVKGETLDAWAIAVICIAVIVIAGAAVLLKFGSRIDFFRRKPKKGYVLVKQEALRIE